MQSYDLTKNFPYEMNFVDLPYGDKSITHRALICSALADGKCRINNPAINCDTLATIDCLQKLGAKITFLDCNAIEVIPFKTPNDNLLFDCKNSGTTARLMAGVVVGLNINAKFVGDKSLSLRPMQRIISPLTQMGANITTPKTPTQIDKEQFLLFEIRPSKTLKSIDYDTQVASAQLKSAILFAGLFAKGDTLVTEPVATRNHTEIMLAQFGCKINHDDCFVKLSPKYPLKAVDVDVPNDFSTASFLLASKINQTITLPNVGLNPTRTAFLSWLKKFGAQIEITDTKTISGEIRGTIKLVKGDFKPVNANYAFCSQMIDEIPICCLLSSLAKGNSRFEGVGELKVKESNRLIGVKQLLNSLNVRVDCNDDDIVVYGNNGFSIDSAYSLLPTDDHRIAMLGVVAGLIQQKYLAPTNPKCISVSTPNFFQLIGFAFNFGLFGIDVANSLSPNIYSALARVTGVKSNYQLFNLQPNCFKDKFVDLIENLNGANLTMPFKSSLTDINNPINTIKNVGGNLIYYNTDGYGVLSAIKEYGIDVKEKIFLILGCGGSAIQAVKTLLKEGARVVVRNRTQQKVKELSKTYPILSEHEGNFDGILSFLPNVPQLNLVSDCEIQNANFVLDACYTHETIFTTKAQKFNKTIIDGKTMLFWQGVKNFEIWTGKQLDQKLIALAKIEFLGDKK